MRNPQRSLAIKDEHGRHGCGAGGPIPNAQAVGGARGGYNEECPGPGSFPGTGERVGAVESSLTGRNCELARTETGMSRVLPRREDMFLGARPGEPGGSRPEIHRGRLTGRIEEHGGT